MRNFLLNFLFPKQCINCEATGEYLCKSCKKTLLPHPEICPYCHRFSANYEVCLNCKAERHPPIEGIIIAFSYQDLIKRLILKLKYYHKSDIADFLAHRLILAMQSNKKIHENIRLTYIPSHWFRHYFVKGYNQSKLLARKLSKISSPRNGGGWFPVIDLATKIHRTHTQAGLNKNQRINNLKNVFKIKEGEIKGDETIIIVDDVTTTGSTIIELAKTIKTQFPKTKIWWLVLARNNK